VICNEEGEALLEVIYFKGIIEFNNASPLLHFVIPGLTRNPLKIRRVWFPAFVGVAQLFGQTRMSVLPIVLSLIVGRTFLSDSLKCLKK